MKNIKDITTWFLVIIIALIAFAFISTSTNKQSYNSDSVFEEQLENTDLSDDFWKNKFMETCMKSGKANKAYCECGHNYLVNNYTSKEFFSMTQKEYDKSLDDMVNACLYLNK